MSRVHIESLMKMRCTVQRNTQTTPDAYGHLEPATWTDHITEQRCWLYTRRGREVIDGRVTAEVQELRAFVPLGTDIGTADRITSLVMIEGGFFSPMIMPGATWEQFQARLAPRDISGTREAYLARMKSSLSMCWSDDVARILLTMVNEDEHGQMNDILRPEHHAQVIRAMWDDPASETWPHIACPTLIVAAGPMPDRADTDFAVMRRKMVEMANKSIADCRVTWIPETIHDIGWHKPDELAGAIKGFLNGD